MRKKITVVGGGHVGETTAHFLAEANLGNIVLIDVIEDMPELMPRLDDFAVSDDEFI